MIRLRRLQSDWEAMISLAEESPFVEFTATGNPPELYVVTFRCKGLAKLPGAPRPSVITQHRVEIYLHANYPRQQPRLTWLTDIFHPNILSRSRNGGVCIGAWTPAETLAQLCIRVAEMVQYKSYNVNDPLDTEAAAWAARYADYLPVDARPIAASPDRPVPVTPGTTIEVW